MQLKSPPSAPRTSTAPKRAALLAVLTLSAGMLAAVPTATAAPGPHEWTPISVIYGLSMGRMIPSTQIGEDAEGNRMAVWNDYVEGQAIFASFAPADGPWVAPIPIDFRTQSQIIGFDFAMSASGDAVAAWLSYYILFGGGVNRYSVDAAFYRAGAGWTYATTVSADDPGLGGNPGRASEPVVAIDDTGGAVILWTQTVDYFGTNETDVYAAHHSGTWVNATTPEVLDTLPGLPDRFDVAALEGDVDVAVWRQVNGSNHSLYASAYTPGSGWSTADAVESALGDVETLSVAAGAPQEAILVWSQGAIGDPEVYASSFAGSAWSPPVMIDAVQGPRGDLRVAANAAGAAVVVGTVVTPPFYPIRGAVFDPSKGGWGAAEELEFPDGFAPTTRPGIDSSGDAMFLWMGIVNVYFPTVMAKRFVNGTGWLASEQVIGEYAAPDDLVVTPGGNASAAIRYFDGTINRPYEVRYLPDDGTTPVDAIAALASRLDAVEATVASLQASLNNSSTEDSISDLWDALNQSAAELAGLEANLTSLKATVDSGSATQGQVSARLVELEAGLVTARAQLNTTSAAAAQASTVAADASTVAARAESGASTATVALIAGIVGAALGAGGVALAIRAGSSNDLRIKEKGNRTKPTSSREGIEGDPEGDDDEADELRAKEKANRTK